jgi:hypothetical protein
MLTSTACGDFPHEVDNALRFVGIKNFVHCHSLASHYCCCCFRLQ